MSNVAANIGREEGEKVDQNCNVTRRSFIFKLLNCTIAHTRWLAMSFADYTIRIRIEVIEPYRY